MDVLAALLPPAVVTALFVTLLVVAYRATDGRRGEEDADEAAPGFGQPYPDEARDEREP